MLVPCCTNHDIECVEISDDTENKYTIYECKCSGCKDKQNVLVCTNIDKVDIKKFNTNTTIISISDKIKYTNGKKQVLSLRYIHYNNFYPLEERVVMELKKQGLPIWYNCYNIKEKKACKEYII